MENIEDIEKLKKQYRPYIQRIIDKNRKFYMFENDIKWDFLYNENPATFALLHDDDYKLFINIKALLLAIERNKPLFIELFIIHEIRHIYQNMIVGLSKKEGTLNVSPFVQQLADEMNGNYIKPEEDVNGYYAQLRETDAFAFSHAVIRYKYGVVDYLILPDFYKTDIRYKQYFEYFITKFKETNL